MQLPWHLPLPLPVGATYQENTLTNVLRYYVALSVAVAEEPATHLIALEGSIKIEFWAWVLLPSRYVGSNCNA